MRGRWFFLEETVFALTHDCLNCGMLFVPGLVLAIRLDNQHMPLSVSLYQIPKQIMVSAVGTTSWLDTGVWIERVTHFSSKICQHRPKGPPDMNMGSSSSVSHLCRLPFRFWCRNQVSWCFWLTTAVFLAGCRENLASNAKRSLGATSPTFTYDYRNYTR